MIRSLKRLVGYRIVAKDGELGHARDFYFDDSTWRIRYLVVDFDKHQQGRQVLLAPDVLREPDWSSGVVPVDLTVEQVRNSPDSSTDLPVSRQHEVRLAGYYHWMPYWVSPGPDGMTSLPAVTVPPPVERVEHPGDPHLRSLVDVASYGVKASDGEIGCIQDFLGHTGRSWVIRYAVVNTRRWLPGRNVLIAPMWLERVDWETKLVHVALTREEIRNSEPFDPAAPINRAYEARLYDYYGRPRYWKPGDEE